MIQFPLNGTGRNRGRRVSGSTEPLRRVFVDLSTILRHDAQTGIQRVVRSVCRELINQNPPELEFHAIAATKWRSYSVVETALLPNSLKAPQRGPLRLGPGDAFLGLDLSAHLFSRHESQLRQWRLSGAEIAVVVYDLLPHSRPEWFNPKTTKYFDLWLNVVGRLAGLVLPISRSVQEDLTNYLTIFHAERVPVIQSRVLPLSGDIGQLDGQQAGNRDPVLRAMQLRPSVLMVGTIEPRKGHAFALAAHRHAWSNLPETAPLLIIAGKPGWHTEMLQAELRNLNLERDGAIWLDDVSDSRLDQLYRACRCVLVASLGEGYCLPLHEALAYGKPVLARNLPVLREMHSQLISYFTKDDPQTLATALSHLTMGAPLAPVRIHCRGWEDSVQIILGALKARRSPLTC